MVMDKFDNEYKVEDVDKYIKKFQDKIYKSLCLREEKAEWEKFFLTLIKEFSGFKELFNEPVSCIEIVSKMLSIAKEENYLEFRKGIFEILHCLDDLKTIQGVD